MDEIGTHDATVAYCQAKLKERADTLYDLEEQARAFGSDPELHAQLRTARRRYELAQKTLLRALAPTRP